MYSSKELAKRLSLRAAPVKAIGAIVGVVGATKVYYVKAPFRSRLALAIALLDGTTNIAKAITITKATIASTTSEFEPYNVKAATELSVVPADIANTELLTGTTPVVAGAVVLNPSTDYSAAKIIIEKDQCIKISVADPTNGKAISGQIVLEFLPA